MVGLQNCTLWQSFGCSVGSCGFANVCNVGGVSLFFFVGGRKKQNKFPSNLHCPVKKLNPFFRYYLSLSYLSIVCLFTLVANVLRLGVVADFQHKSSIEELNLNLPQNCHTKHCTPHYAKPLLPAGLLLSSYNYGHFFVKFW